MSIFTPTPLDGVVVVTMEHNYDDRGSFARLWCQKEFAGQGLNPELAQCSVSVNTRQGTLRGLHYQAPPHAEAKLVRCSRGAIFDVAVDLRAASPARGRWFGIELSAASPRMLYIGEGFAHGFITLSDDAEVSYFISAWFEPAAARGIRWDDPDIAIDWPIPPAVISSRDRELPFLRDLSDGR